MTALTKTGRPRMGATFEVQLEDLTWGSVKCVGYGTNRVGQTVVLWIEFPDGAREGITWPTEFWRAGRGQT